MNTSLICVLIALSGFVSALPSVPYNEEEHRLIKTSEAEPARWLSQEEIFSLIHKCVNFMDVTDREYQPLERDPAAPSAYPVSMRFQTAVRERFANVQIPWMEDFVTDFSTSFRNRYYNNQLGVESSEALLGLARAGADGSAYIGNVTVLPFTHSWLQDSIIARIEGSEPGVVILGAHQDSINSEDHENGVAPGADDNASGTVALLEAFFILLESDFVPKKSVEFHWYAAEEVGLRGSQDIAETYMNQSVDVVSMLNFDVVGYHTGTFEIAFRHDFTDADLNQFISMVVEEYLDFNLTDGNCGYACSDHASWNSFGFPSAFFKESVSFPDMHTVRDTVDRVDFEQIAEFVKLAIGYIIELAEPAL